MIVILNDKNGTEQRAHLAKGLLPRCEKLHSPPQIHDEHNVVGMLVTWKNEAWVPGLISCLPGPSVKFQAKWAILSPKAMWGSPEG